MEEEENRETKRGGGKETEEEGKGSSGRDVGRGGEVGEEEHREWKSVETGEHGERKRDGGRGRGI